MKLLKMLLRPVINPIDEIENKIMFLPKNTETIVIKTPDKSQAFRVIKILDDETIIVNGDSIANEN